MRPCQQKVCIGRTQFELPLYLRTGHPDSCKPRCDSILVPHRENTALLIHSTVFAFYQVSGVNANYIGTSPLKKRQHPVSKDTSVWSNLWLLETVFLRDAGPKSEILVVCYLQALITVEFVFSVRFKGLLSFRECLILRCPNY